MTNETQTPNKRPPKAVSKAKRKPKEPVRPEPEYAWDQQLTESDEAYEAFIGYRDTGTSRSHRAVARKLGKSGSLISRWASDWNWTERLTAWNRAERARLDAERIEQQRKILDVELQDAEELLRRYHEMVKAANGIHKTPQIIEVADKTDPTKKDKVKIIEVDIGGLRELIKMRKDIRDLQRGAVGLPATITQTQLTGSEGGPMDVTHTHKVSADTMASLAKQIEEYERGKRAAPQRSDPTQQS